MDDKKWSEYVDTLAGALKFGAKEKESLKKNSLAKFITGIPVRAGCRNMDRKALANLSIYVLSTLGGKKFTAPNKEDDIDILERIERFGSFPDGDKDVIKRDMAQLGLAMLEDYKRDMEADEKQSKYNPLASGAFDYETEKKKLQAIVDSISKDTGARIISDEGPEWWAI